MKRIKFRPSISKKGFTLVKMITVITTIGILAALLFPIVTGFLCSS